MASEFPMFAKISVKGADRHPLYDTLAGETDVGWNFEKFLIALRRHDRRPLQPADGPEDAAVVGAGRGGTRQGLIGNAHRKDDEAGIAPGLAHFGGIRRPRSGLFAVEHAGPGTASPASAAPMNGATMNSQSWPSACPPANSAGPRLRAGLTETPVTLMPTMWIMTSVRPMARPAKWLSAILCVTPRMTTRKMKVATISNRSAETRLYSPR